MNKEDLIDIVTPDMYTHLDTLVEQIWYWRTHIDRFIMDYLHIKLFDFQQVFARAVGNGDDISGAMSRGTGKTWLLAPCAIALAILWPGSPIVCVSKSAHQANLLLEKIRDELLPNDEISREIDYAPSKGIKIRSNGRSEIFFKNGSIIRALVLGQKGDNILGARGKVLIIDESKLIPNSIVRKAAGPILNYKRPIFYSLREEGFNDYPSKMINISSAYFSSCDYFDRFKNTFSKMASGDTRSFACALNKDACIRVGMQDASYYERERDRMSAVEFAMEYDTVFVGANDNTVFPYSLTERCRVLDRVELKQPKGSTTSYVIASDVAGNGNVDTADNSCVAVIKIVEKENGHWQKQLVWMSAYRCISQRELAEEIRKVYLRFPNTVAIIYDANAIGRGLESLFDQPYTYEDDRGNKVEMPPLLAYNSSAQYRAVKILHPFIGTNALNAEMVGVLTRNFEDQEFLLPVVSATVDGIDFASRLEDDDDSDEQKDVKAERARLVTEEALVFKEADELQCELGNIVGKMSSAGNIVYGTAMSTQRKDRFSTVAMAMWLIDRMETENRRSGYVAADDDMPFAVSGL